MTDSPDLTALYRDALNGFATAACDALNIPIAALGQLDSEQALRNSRSEAVRCGAAMILDAGEDAAAVARTVEWLRNRIEQLPVTYDRYIIPGNNHPDGCEVHEPEEPCCSPVVSGR